MRTAHDLLRDALRPEAIHKCADDLSRKTTGCQGLDDFRALAADVQDLFRLRMLITRFMSGR